MYVREIARVDGKPKVVSQAYIGSPAKVLSFATGQEQGPIKLKVEEFGALWLAQQINQDIDLCAIVDEVIPRADREKGPTIGEYFLYWVIRLFNGYIPYIVVFAFLEHDSAFLPLNTIAWPKRISRPSPSGEVLRTSVLTSTFRPCWPESRPTARGWPFLTSGLGII